MTRFAPTGQTLLESYENPIGVTGVCWVEFSTQTPEMLQHFLTELGFIPFARHEKKNILVYQHGTIHILINAEPDLFFSHETARVSAIGLGVRDEKYAYQNAMDRGAIFQYQQEKPYAWPRIWTPSGLAHYFLNPQDMWTKEFETFSIPSKEYPFLFLIKKITVCIENHMAEKETEYYKKLFHFRERQPHGDLISPCENISIAFASERDILKNYGLDLNITSKPNYILTLSAMDIEEVMNWLDKRDVLYVIKREHIFIQQNGSLIEIEPKNKGANISRSHDSLIG